MKYIILTKNFADTHSIDTTHLRANKENDKYVTKLDSLEVQTIKRAIKSDFPIYDGEDKEFHELLTSPEWSFSEEI